jgi:8-hydroxy-5-deazaflavin:NADPH oxidoreductase
MMQIAMIGAGNVATNLGGLINQAGHPITFGVKDAAADQARLQALFACRVESVAMAAKQGEIIFLAIPYPAVKTVAECLRQELAGKIVVDLTNPLNADWSPVVLGAENSAGETLTRLLPDSRVVKAFNTIFADVMNTAGQRFGDKSLTAFVCGNDAAANQTVADLANQAGFSALIVGEMKNARYLEAIAHLNIQIAVGMQGGTSAGFVYARR